jgi:hypothetical protein
VAFTTSTGGNLRVTLNGATFTASSDILFRFESPNNQLHAPELLDAWFGSDLETLTLMFDGQPTDRAGMLELGLCAPLIAPDVLSVIRGSSRVDPQCLWTTDTTVTVYLPSGTRAQPGMRVAIRPDVLRPARYNGPCLDFSRGYVFPPLRRYCALEHIEVTTQAGAPCDRRETEVVEACAPVTAAIRAPRSISSCDSVSLVLDGSYSAGGGVVAPLQYRWFAEPRTTDNYHAIQALLDLAGNTPFLTLSSSDLRGVNELVVGLEVTRPTLNGFVGATATTDFITISRSSQPIPTVTIDGPPLVFVRRALSTMLVSRAVRAGCMAPSSLPLSNQVRYEWSEGPISVLPGYRNFFIPTLMLDEASMRERTLVVPGANMRIGFAYALRLRACVEVQAVELMNETISFNSTTNITDRTSVV